MLNGIKIEICAGSTQDVQTASKYREIDRIELNSHLEEDGLTPSHALFSDAQRSSAVPLFPMVRMHGGAFTANQSEKADMLSQAEYFLQNGAAGIVFGILHEDLTLDQEFTEKMIDLIHSYGKEAVFHKAFDVSKDPDACIQELIRLHADRVLTSGRKPSSLDGADFICRLNEKYGEEIQIQPAGGVNGDNVVQILAETGCTRFHMSLRSDHESMDEKIQHALDSIRRMKPAKRKEILTGEDQAMLENDQFESSYEDQDDDHDQL